MSRTKILSLALSVAVVSSVALTSCGTKTDDEPEVASSVAEVREAFTALGDSDRIAVAFSLDVSDGVTEQLLAEVPEEERDAARTALGAQAEFKIVYPDGVAISETAGEVDPWKTHAQFEVTTSSTLLDVRFAEETLYGFVGLDAISELAGSDVREDLAAEAEGSPFADAAQAILDGRHLSLDRETLEDLNEEVSELGGGPARGPADVDPEQVEAMLDALADSFDANATVSDGGEGYTTLTVNSEGFFADVKDAVAADPTLSETIDEAGMAELDELSDQVPDLTVDVLIVDGEAAEVRLDLAQFASAVDQAKLKFSPSDRFDLVLGFSTDFDIEAPADAEPVDDVVRMLLDDQI